MFKKSSLLVLKGARKLVLQPREAWLICRMGWWLSVLSLSVKFRPLPAALQMVSPKPAARIGDPGVESYLRKKLAGAVDLLLSANLFIFKPICWKRAAILHRYLALNGIPTRIVFGVRNEVDCALRGHAWLEAEGHPILERVMPDYTVTYTFPSSDRFDIDLASLTRT